MDAYDLTRRFVSLPESGGFRAPSGRYYGVVRVR